MRFKNTNYSIILGLVATTGILIAQLFWTKETFDLEQKKFSQRVHIALLEVVKKLYLGTNSELPNENPIQKIANDYYIVNVENDFKPEILEFYLKQEFTKFNILTDFEYAMYNCRSDEMVYGNYISFEEKKSKTQTVYFPKHKNFVYYFVVRFPHENSFLLRSLKFWIVLTITLLIILLVYVHSIYTIIQQKKYADLQIDFINNMTHEFKTPISSILIASNYLKNQHQIYKDEKLKNYAQIIINQGNQLNLHIEKVLQIAKTDNSNFEIATSRLDLISLIENSIALIQLKYPASQISIDTLKPIFVEADAFHVANLVYNLLDNSVKYCEDKPKIKITISRTKSNLELEFTDNGIGISEEKLQFVFDKFYRITSEKSIENSGFGLGLYYVKKIVLLHKWKISIQNNSEKGISITIKIPISDG